MDATKLFDEVRELVKTMTDEELLQFYNDTIMSNKFLHRFEDEDVWLISTARTSLILLEFNNRKNRNLIKNDSNINKSK